MSKRQSEVVIRAGGEVAGEVKRRLERLGWKTRIAETTRDAIRLGAMAGVVFCDRDLDDGDWREVVAGSAAPVVVFSRHADESEWMEALDGGAFDMVAPPFEDRELGRIIGLAASGARPGDAPLAAAVS